MKKQNDYILHFRLAANGKIQSIKDMLYGNRIIRVASINPKDLVYAITTSHKEMRLIFESLKSFLEMGEAMAYECNEDKMFCDCFVKPRNEVIVYMR